MPTIVPTARAMQCTVMFNVIRPSSNDLRVTNIKPEGLTSSPLEQQRAANSPTIVESLAATDLPSMSSGKSDDSIGEHLNKAN